MLWLLFSGGEECGGSRGAREHPQKYGTNILRLRVTVNTKRRIKNIPEFGHEEPAAPTFSSAQYSTADERRSLRQQCTRDRRLFQTCNDENDRSTAPCHAAVVLRLT
jgi:hypothetical protein